jgi:CPA2 family monovalent cation:H+ antiporter-2
MHALLTDLSIVFLAAVVVVLALGRIGSPPVVGFLVAGVLVGPGGLGLVGDPHQVEVMAELGVALLLFTIGLEFSLERLARIGRYVALGGGLQVVLTVAAATGVAVLAGQAWTTGVFWGYLAALSSTAIVLRALADREESGAPHGRLIIAVLIFQDLCIVPMVLTLPVLAGQGGGWLGIAATMAKAAAVVVGVVVLARRIVPWLLHRVAAARRRELFLLTVLVVALLVATATSSLGLSVALGAFLAGVVIADTDFVHQAANDVAPFRDALASTFFVSIGMLLDPRVLVDEPWLTLGAVAALIGGKLALATLAGLVMRFPARVALLSGVGLAQVGEFSFVLLASGRELGLASDEAARVFIAASVLTMAATPLLIAASPRFVTGAAILRPIERLFAIRNPEEEQADDAEALSGHVVVAGLGLGGQLLLSSLEAAKVPYVAIELNPETVIRERKGGRRVRYGDIASPEVLAHVAHAGTASALVLLLSDAEAARRAAAVAKAAYPSLHVVVRAHRTARDEAELRALGAEVVSEDYETALEIVERVLARTGVTGDLLRGALSAARGVRSADGERTVSTDGLLQTLGMDAVTIAAGDRCVGRALADLGLREGPGALVIALARGGEVLSPVASTVLAVGDVVFLFGRREQFASPGTAPSPATNRANDRASARAAERGHPATTSARLARSPSGESAFTRRVTSNRAGSASQSV